MFNNVNTVHFKFLPMSMRMLFSMTLLVLGTGYCMAMVQVWVTHVGLDGKNYLTTQDLIIAYSGNKSGSKMESALKGPMSGMLDDANKQIVYSWLQKGAPKSEYDTTIKPILQSHCVMCHNPTANPTLPNYTTWIGVQKVTKTDTGMSIDTLIRIAHIHLFGITFIFFIMGFIYAHAYVRPMWFKCLTIAIPFLSLLADVACWYLTKVWTGFAWVIMISGALYGIAFTIMWFTSMYQMWLYNVPPELIERNGELPTIRGDN